MAEEHLDVTVHPAEQQNSGTLFACHAVSLPHYTACRLTRSLSG
jgi:hypothetical protein